MILPSSSRFIRSGFLPRNTFVSIGSRRGSIGGFVTWEAFISILSQYTGKGLGLPIDESSTPPLFACLYISFIVLSDQLAFSPRRQSLLTILSALVGHNDTHLWQLTHLLSSDSITPSSESKRCTSFAHCLSQTLHAIHLSLFLSTSKSGYINCSRIRIYPP